MTEIYNIAKNKFKLFLKTLIILSVGFIILNIISPQYAVIPAEIFRTGYIFLGYILDIGLNSLFSITQYSTIFLILGVVYIVACAVSLIW